MSLPRLSPRWISLVVMFALLGTFCTSAQLQRAFPTAPASQPLDFGTTALAFIANAGQSDPAVRFQAGALGGTLFFTPDGVTVALPPSDRAAATTTLSVQFDGANPAPALRGAELAPGAINYLVGN